MITKRFIRFIYPGLIFSETTMAEIDEKYSVVQAVQDAQAIKPVKPYAFQFIVKGREDHELDSKVLSTSATYFIGGKVETVEEIAARNDPRDEILIGNMRCNGYARVVSTNRGTYPLNEGDVVV